MSKFEPSSLISTPAPPLLPADADMTRLTCPFAQLRRKQLPVAQDPDSEARQQPVDQPESQGGHGERTDPEQRLLSPAERLFDVHPLHDGVCACDGARAETSLLSNLL